MPPCLAGFWALAALAAAPFGVQVVDEATGRGVPLVELSSVNQVRFVTDSAGYAALDEPGWAGREVYLHVFSHGYEYPADGFGYRGVRVVVKPGELFTIKLRRKNIAERLYRITGGGIYRDSVLLGKPPPSDEPLLRSQVLGSDSVVAAVHGDRVFWFWGDTNRLAYPLGNFHVPGATTAWTAAGLNADQPLALSYFEDPQGFAKPTAKMPGDGPTWMTTLVSLPDREGQAQLCASYVKVKPPLAVYRRGLMRWDEAQQQFQPQGDFPQDAAAFPEGHAFVQRTDAGEQVYFGNPFPTARVAATAEAFFTTDQYESYTCLGGGDLDRPQFARDAAGRLHYAWRKGLPAVTPAAEDRWLKAGQITTADLRWLLPSAADPAGPRVQPHAGSLNWNAFRKRWVTIFVQVGGTSFLGEVWYAEAETPAGPWSPAVKVASHEKYSFYNPKHHAFLDRDGGRFIYFEGTYTHTFSGNPQATPRYDYNQILYRLDLADPRLHGK